MKLGFALPTAGAWATPENQIRVARQAEAGAFLLPRIVAPHLAELLEDGRLVLGGDPDTAVGDGDFDRPIRQPGLDADPAPFRGELDRIGKEVEQDLLDLALVTYQLAQSRIQVQVQGDRVAGRPLPDEGDGILQGARQMERGRG
jgi:hypothetical protein